MAVAAAARPAWLRPMNTLTCTRLVSGIARTPACCPAIGAVLRTRSREVWPDDVAAAPLTPLTSSVVAAATESAEVVSILWAGIQLPLLGRAMRCARSDLERLLPDTPRNPPKVQVPGRSYKVVRKRRHPFGQGAEPNSSCS